MTASWQSLDSFVHQTQPEDDSDSDRWVSYHLDDLYPEWQTQAECASAGHAAFFGDEEQQPTMSIKQVRNAAKLCAICPVYTECLRHALTQREEYGVWAGTSGRVRRKIFSLIDHDLACVEDVIERFLNGQGDFYKSLTIPEPCGAPDGGEQAYGAEQAGQALTA